jgi:hypothetical protein
MSKANKGSTGRQYDALSCNAGLAGSTAVLDDGARLGAYEADENPKRKKKVSNEREEGVCLVETVQGTRPPRDPRNIIEETHKI